MSPEELLAITAAPSPPAEKLPRGKGAEWTCAEAGMAGNGVEQKSWYALRFSYAGDESVRRWLRLHLLLWARKRRLRKRWRWKTPRSTHRSYLADLVAMSFDEERHPSVFQTGRIWPIIMYVREQVWADALSPIYEDIRLEYMHWGATGKHQMRDWLNGDDEDA